MRINQYIAKHTGISRRSGDELVAAGGVKVNGEVARPGIQVKAGDVVEYLTKGRWRTVTSSGTEDGGDTVLLMYKPVRVMTTHDDPQGRNTVFDVLPARYGSFKTAGRLDYMSEGLLVLSANGHLILSLTHPKFKTRKTYLVGLNKKLHESFLIKAIRGDLVIDGYRLNAVEVREADATEYGYLKLSRSSHWYQFTLTEGRNRQIRKMVELDRCSVTRLIRIAHGPFRLNPEIVHKGFIETTMLKPEARR